MGAGKHFDAAIAAIARVIDDAPVLSKATLRPLHIRPLVTLSVRARLWKTNGANAIATATALPSAATSQLHRVIALTTLCFQEGVTPADKASAVDQAFAAMPAVERECGIEVRFGVD